MSNTVIQIKRSTTTAVPTNLQPGELAYTSNGEVLYIGSVLGSNTANVVAIAGQRSPGVLTANQALVANSSSWIDALKTSKLIIGSTSETINIASIATTGNSTTVGTPSNTELATTYAIKKFVDDKTAAIAGAVTDTQIVFSNSGIFTGDAAFTFNDDTKKVSISNTLTVGSNLTVSNNNVFIGNSTVNAALSSTVLTFRDSVGDVTTITSNGISISNSVVANTSTLRIGGDLLVNSTATKIGNSTVNTTISFTGLVAIDTVNTTTVNNSVVSVGANVVANSTTVRVGNVTINTTGIAAQDIITVGTGLSINTTTISVGNSTVNTTIKAGNIALQGTQLTVGNVVITGSQFSIGDSVINTTAMSVGNSTSNVSILSSGVLTTTGLANLQTANVVANLNVGGVLRAGNTTITGDLTVTGTVTTVDTTNLVVEDPLIRLARNQANTGTYTDAVDIGFYGVYGNTSVTYYTGFARNANTNSWVLFANNSTAPDNAGVSTTDTLATLYSQLNTGALVTNTTSVSLTSNSTVSVTITANSLTLSTPLAIGSGGTGKSVITANAVLVGNGSGPLTEVISSTEGHVLQIASGVPAFGMLDGGTF